MRGTAYVSIFILFIQLFELEYIGELQFSGCFFLIHSNLIHSYIDVYMLHFGFYSCICYYREWSIIPFVTQWVLVIYFLNGSVHMLVQVALFYGPNTFLLC